MDFIYILPYLVIWSKGTVEAWNSHWNPPLGTTLDQYFLEEFQDNRIVHDFAQNLDEDRDTYEEICRNIVRYSAGEIHDISLDHPIPCKRIIHVPAGINDTVRLRRDVEGELPAPDLLFCQCGFDNRYSILGRNKDKGYFTFSAPNYPLHIDPKDNQQIVYEVENYWLVDKYKDLVQRLRTYKPTITTIEIGFPALDELLERTDMGWSETDLSACIIHREEIRRERINFVISASDT